MTTTTSSTTPSSTEQGSGDNAAKASSATRHPASISRTWTLEQLLGYGSSWSASARYRAALGHDPIERLRPPLAAAWGAAETPRRLHWPLTIKASRLGWA